MWATALDTISHSIFSAVFNFSEHFNVDIQYPSDWTRNNQNMIAIVAVRPNVVVG
jgi:hypothetical protein